MITAFSSIDGAIEAMKRGAFHYIPKPFKNDEVCPHGQQGAGAAAPRRARTSASRQSSPARSPTRNIIGKSERMRKVFDLIRLAAPSRTNDPHRRRERHRQGARGAGAPPELGARDRAFVTVNSGNLPPDLLESNLFGHVKGAFTGAVDPKKGPVRAGRQGDDLPRRDRQHPARDAGQAAARDPGARVHAPRRRRDDQGRRAHHRRDQRRPPQDDGRGASSARTSTTA